MWAEAARGEGSTRIYPCTMTRRQARGMVWRVALGSHVLDHDALSCVQLAIDVGKARVSVAHDFVNVLTVISDDLLLQIACAW